MLSQSCTSDFTGDAHQICGWSHSVTFSWRQTAGRKPQVDIQFVSDPGLIFKNIRPGRPRADIWWLTNGGRCIMTLLCTSLKERLEFTKYPSGKGITAILYWTYRAELTNDPSFRVNQKWMTVKPHAWVRNRWNTTARFATLHDWLCDR